MFGRQIFHRVSYAILSISSNIYLLIQIDKLIVQLF